MNRKLIATAILLGGLLFWLALQFRGGESVFSWREHYRINSKDPYGTYVLYELLKHQVPPEDFHTLTETDSFTLPDSFANASYLFIGRSFEPEPPQLEVLLDFVYAGNQAFISCPRFPEELMIPLMEYICEEPYWGDHELTIDTSAYLSVGENPAHSFTFRYDQGTSNYYWSYFSADSSCDGLPAFEVLGHLNGEFSNYIRLPFGSGSFLLHATPLALTSYFITEEPGLVYAEEVLNYLDGRELYWDEWMRSVEYGRKQERNPAGNSDYAISPVRYILNHPPLAWAWYVLLVLGLLFLLFRSRRIQRVIPVAAVIPNSSLEFITTIGNLYHYKRSYKQIALLAMKSLMLFIRNRYRQPVRENMSGFEDRIATLSGVPVDLLQSIDNRYEAIKNSPKISSGDLMGFYQMLERFYHTCK